MHSCEQAMGRSFWASTTDGMHNLSLPLQQQKQKVAWGVLSLGIPVGLAAELGRIWTLLPGD